MKLNWLLKNAISYYHIFPYSLLFFEGYCIPYQINWSFVTRKKISYV